MNLIQQVEEQNKNKHTTYKKWLGEITKLESSAGILWVLSQLVPLCLYLMMCEKISVINILVACLIYNGIFVSFHVTTHTLMLFGHGVTMAYYHHYVDSSLYPKVPFGYRLHSTAPLIFATGMSILTMCDRQVFAMIIFIFTIDYWCHEYAHGKRFSTYTSMKPWSAYFIGYAYLGLFLEKMKMVDIEHHRKVHHREKAETMENTEAFTDLQIPIIWKFWEFFADANWEFEKYLLRSNGAVDHEKCSGLNYNLILFILAIKISVIMFLSNALLWLFGSDIVFTFSDFVIRFGCFTVLLLTRILFQIKYCEDECTTE
jgi:hypothetical protein